MALNNVETAVGRNTFSGTLVDGGLRVVGLAIPFIIGAGFGIAAGEGWDLLDGENDINMGDSAAIGAGTTLGWLLFGLTIKSLKKN